MVVWQYGRMAVWQFGSMAVWQYGSAHLTLSWESLSFFEAMSTVPPTILAPLISTNMSPAWILGSGEGGGREGRKKKT